MSNLAKTVFRFVGVSCIIFAFLGLLTNSVTLIFVLADSHQISNAPHFKVAVLVMSAICAVCYFTLLFFGIRFLRLNSRLYPLFVGLVVFEVIYVFSIWIIVAPFGEKVLMSVGAATGIANGGLMYQILTLFPLWGPLLVHRANRELREA